MMKSTERRWGALVSAQMSYRYPNCLSVIEHFSFRHQVLKDLVLSKMASADPMRERCVPLLEDDDDDDDDDNAYFSPCFSAFSVKKRKHFYGWAE